MVDVEGDEHTNFVQSQPPVEDLRMWILSE